ncbi:MAG: 50S ribosomal protein L19e [Methanomicrobiales archaeon]
MTDLGSRRRLAAEVLGCGMNRIWFNPERLDDIEGAISREDIRGLIDEGAIQVRQKRGVSRGRARIMSAKRSYGHRKGPGRRKGGQNARDPSKTRWIRKIRAQRMTLRALRDDGTIDRSTYRLMYRKASGGQFRSVAHLKAQLDLVTGRRT